MPKPSGRMVTAVPTTRKICLKSPYSVCDRRRTSSGGSRNVKAKPSVLANISQNARAVSEVSFLSSSAIYSLKFKVQSYKFKVKRLAPSTWNLKLGTLNYVLFPYRLPARVALAARELPEGEHRREVRQHEGPREREQSPAPSPLLDQPAPQGGRVEADLRERRERVEPRAAR